MKIASCFLIILALAFPCVAQRDPTSAELARRYIDVSIAAGAAVSEAVAVAACTVAGIQMPKTADGWTAAGLTFQASADGTTYGELKDEFGSVKSVTATVDDYIALNPGDWWSVRFLKIRSGTSGTPVNQVAARTIRLICR